MRGRKHYSLQLEFAPSSSHPLPKHHQHVHLLTGGTGRTSTRLSHLLQAANKRVLLTYRKSTVAASFMGVHFDWNDPATFENPFTADPNIEGVYLLPPVGSPDAFTPMKPFIDLAVQKGVKRFVLLSASTLEPGYPVTGKVREYLLTLGVDYCVLRPTWFFENFTAGHLDSIKNKNTIVSASADGKVGFVSTEDIAATAFDALTRAESYNSDFILVGPQLLSYDDVAAIFSKVLGRPITHTRVTAEELRQAYLSMGVPAEYAGMLSSMETVNAEGVEEKIFVNPKKAPNAGHKTLKAFVEENKALWA